MTPDNTSRLIDLLRLGNPWLVGKNVSRVVPIYSMHNVLAPSFVTDQHVQKIKDVTQNGTLAQSTFDNKISFGTTSATDFEETAFGVFSPERRVFQKLVNTPSGLERRAHKEGALFPLLGGLAQSTSSDDGLGRRIRELLDCYDSDWPKRLKILFAPTNVNDPVSAFAALLMHSPPGDLKKNQSPAKRKITDFDLSIVEFVDALIVGATHGDRYGTIRNLAYGIYLASIIRMTSGPIRGAAKPAYVVAYAGLPPGAPTDPIVRFAVHSYRKWIGESWTCTVAAIAQAIKAPRIKKIGKPKSDLRTSIHAALMKSKCAADETGRILDALKPAINDYDGSSVDEWLSDTLDSATVGFPQHELSRRVRALGTSIGAIGPDRGAGSPRLIFDTPLLGVLVNGLVPREGMSIDEFVSCVAARLGIVLGPGKNDELVGAVADVEGRGPDVFELLRRNQDLLRERLIRVGLARTYSDSHTEVFSNG